MAYKDEILEFFGNKIVINDESGAEVMMDWEDDIMKSSAEFICHNKGDILEIGFGMGISATHIQSHDINSHTIIEINDEEQEEYDKGWYNEGENLSITISTN